MNNEYLFFYLQGVEGQISSTDGHDEDGADGTNGLRGKAHEEREDSSSKQSHYHETGHFILLCRFCFECFCKDDGEDVGVAETYQGDACIKDGLALADSHEDHRGNNHHCGDEEEQFAGHETQYERTGETTECTEDEVKGGGKCRFVECPSKPLHEQFGRGGVGAYIDTHMAHDAEEAEEHERVSQQFEAVDEA